MAQRVVVERLLPIANLDGTENADGSKFGDPSSAIDYLFEPTPEELLGTFLPFHVAVQVNSGAAGIVGGRARGPHDGDGQRHHGTPARWWTG